MLSLLFLTVLCEAHVKLIHSADFTLPIRNALTPSGDGQYSTDGPCGSKTAAWGRQGFTNVNAGDNISLVFAYNGGHQSPTDNILNVIIVCGRDALYNASAALTAGSLPITACAPVNASQSLTSGYKLWAIVPQINQSITNGSSCTMSVADKRHWGGCIDIVIAAAVTPTPVPVNALADKNLGGSYTFGVSQCTPDSPNCCCVGGTATVTADAGATTGTIAISYANASCAAGAGLSDTTASVTLTQVASTLASMKGQWTNQGRMLTVQIQAGNPNTLSITDDSATPSVCGLAAMATSEEESAASVHVGMTAAGLFALSLLL